MHCPNCKREMTQLNGNVYTCVECDIISIKRTGGFTAHSDRPLQALLPDDA